MKFEKTFIALRVFGLISLIIFFVLAILEIFPIAYLFLFLTIASQMATTIYIRYQVKLNRLNQ